PECAFDYDPCAIFIRLKVKRGYANQLLMIALLFTAMVHFAESSFSKENIVLTVVLMAATIPLLIVVLTPSRFSLTVNRFGVTLEGHDEENLCISWKDIQTIRFNWLNGNIVVRGIQAKQLTIAYLQIGGFLRARKLARVIEGLRKKYSTMS